MKRYAVKTAVSVIIAIALLLVLCFQSIKTFSYSSKQYRFENSSHMLAEQLSIKSDRISLAAEPKWYQFKPEHWVFKVDNNEGAGPQYYIIDSEDRRQNGKPDQSPLFREIDALEINKKSGSSEGIIRAVVFALAALVIIIGLIVRPMIRIIDKRQDQVVT
ncbi:MAG: hypothetical protein IKX89_01725 [Firmicutes bacterium]|nr:hypothetical protein [Bacillota bacterium]